MSLGTWHVAGLFLYLFISVCHSVTCQFSSGKRSNWEKKRNESTKALFQQRATKSPPGVAYHELRSLIIIVIHHLSHIVVQLDHLGLPFRYRLVVRTERQLQVIRGVVGLAFLSLTTTVIRMTKRVLCLAQSSICFAHDTLLRQVVGSNFVHRLQEQTLAQTSIFVCCMGDRSVCILCGAAHPPNSAPRTYVDGSLMINIFSFTHR